MKPTALAAVLATSVFLVAWGSPASSEAGLKVKFKSGDFKASYRSGGYGGYYGGKRFRGGYGYFPRRYYGYYAPYAYWGPSVYSVSYGYPTGPVNYLPPQYASQPQQTSSTTNRETVSNSPGAIIINSENTVIYNNAPNGTPVETTEKQTTSISPGTSAGQLSQASQPIRYQYAAPRRYGY